MSNLISRNAVIDLICELLKISEYDGGKILMMLDDIKNLPTAYDVDKVVDQLESKSVPCGAGKCIYTEETQIGCEECVKMKAIEIVKGGGVDE